ncbi:hypothetical protein GFL93_18110 [Rhizobium leguminosarum bv. viciae]|nr:hypothetical protein [Rhizobium leguminosarum bv. viciae]
METQNRSKFLFFTQFRTESRFTLFLELLWRSLTRQSGTICQLCVCRYQPSVPANRSGHRSR